jgi:hypothetical protein
MGNSIEEMIKEIEFVQDYEDYQNIKDTEKLVSSIILRKKQI